MSKVWRWRLNVIEPGRLRSIERPFGWMACRMLTEGFLGRMSLEAKVLYLGLCLASNRGGLSCWPDKKLQKQLGLKQELLFCGREELLSKDLVAFDGVTYQVLSLPMKVQAMENIEPRAEQKEDFKPADPEHVARIIKSIRSKLGS